MYQKKTNICYFHYNLTLGLGFSKEIGSFTVDNHSPIQIMILDSFRKKVGTEYNNVFVVVKRKELLLDETIRGN